MSLCLVMPSVLSIGGLGELSETGSRDYIQPPIFRSIERLWSRVKIGGVGLDTTEKQPTFTANSA